MHRSIVMFVCSDLLSPYLTLLCLRITSAQIGSHCRGTLPAAGWSQEGQREGVGVSETASGERDRQREGERTWLRSARDEKEAAREKMKEGGDARWWRGREGRGYEEREKRGEGRGCTLGP